MQSKTEIEGRLSDPGVIAVVRAPSAEMLVPLSEALLAGGVDAIEITMTTPSAIEGIRQVKSKLGDTALVGVGSVTDGETCEGALKAGAEFVVSPVLRTRLIAIAHGAGKPVMLGAFTPTEAQLAHEAGADFVKIFPAEMGGAGYIKSIRAPLPHLRVVPTGGVNLDSLKDFLAAGCVALGVGSSLVSRRILHEKDWGGLTERAKAFVAGVAKAREELTAG